MKLLRPTHPSVNTKMTRLRGRARKGRRLKAKAPFGKWGTQTFIAGLRHDGLTAPWVIPGAMDRAMSTSRRNWRRRLRPAMS